MKIVIGVDVTRHYKSTLNMVARLRLERSDLRLVNCIDVTMPYSGIGLGTETSYAADFVRLETEEGESALEEAIEDACVHGIRAQTALLVGGPAAEIARYGDEVHADLVAVHSERKGRFGSFFLGSVSRGLAIGSKQSLLITKGFVSPTGPITAVLATDHSEYAGKALDQFIKMNPQGIKAIHVVSALHVSGDDVVVVPGFAIAAPPAIDYLQAQVQIKNNDVVRHLNEAGFEATGEVVDAPVNEAIHDAMENRHAELLVMGAQGHGFMHRLVLGSTSLHQVVAEPYSVLILRHEVA